MFELEFLDIEKESSYESIIEKVLKECFREENLDKTKLYVEITLTTSNKIKKINNEFRNIDKPTDVLSFPIFEKEELENGIRSGKFDTEDMLGSIVVSVEKVKEQATEYGHSFQRELSYMIVHGFYHLMGYDHIKESDKVEMRQKEENILNKLKIVR